MYNRDQQLCSEIKAAVYSSSGEGLQLETVTQYIRGG